MANWYMTDETPEEEYEDDFPDNFSRHVAFIKATGNVLPDYRTNFHRCAYTTSNQWYTFICDKGCHLDDHSSPCFCGFGKFEDDAEFAYHDILKECSNNLAEAYRFFGSESSIVEKLSTKVHAELMIQADVYGKVIWAYQICTDSQARPLPPKSPIDFAKVWHRLRNFENYAPYEIPELFQCVLTQYFPRWIYCEPEIMHKETVHHIFLRLLWENGSVPLWEVSALDIGETAFWSHVIQCVVNGSTRCLDYLHDKVYSLLVKTSPPGASMLDSTGNVRLLLSVARFFDQGGAAAWILLHAVRSLRDYFPVRSFSSCVRGEDNPPSPNNAPLFLLAPHQGEGRILPALPATVVRDRLLPYLGGGQFAKILCLSKDLASCYIQQEKARLIREDGDPQRAYRNDARDFIGTPEMTRLLFTHPCILKESSHFDCCISQTIVQDDFTSFKRLAENRYFAIHQRHFHEAQARRLDHFCVFMLENGFCSATYRTYMVAAQTGQLQLLQYGIRTVNADSVKTPEGFCAGSEKTEDDPQIPYVGKNLLSASCLWGSPKFYDSVYECLLNNLPKKGVYQFDPSWDTIAYACRSGSLDILKHVQPVSPLSEMYSAGPESYCFLMQESKEGRFIEQLLVECCIEHSMDPNTEILEYILPSLPVTQDLCRRRISTHTAEKMLYAAASRSLPLVIDWILKNCYSESHFIGLWLEGINMKNPSVVNLCISQNRHGALRTDYLPELIEMGILKPRYNDGRKRKVGSEREIHWCYLDEDSEPYRPAHKRSYRTVTKSFCMHRLLATVKSGDTEAIDFLLNHESQFRSAEEYHKSLFSVLEFSLQNDYDTVVKHLIHHLHIFRDDQLWQLLLVALRRFRHEFGKHYNGGLVSRVMWKDEKWESKKRAKQKRVAITMVDWLLSFKTRFEFDTEHMNEILTYYREDDRSPDSMYSIFHKICNRDQDTDQRFWDDPKYDLADEKTLTHLCRVGLLTHLKEAIARFLEYTDIGLDAWMDYRWETPWYREGFLLAIKYGHLHIVKYLFKMASGMGEVICRSRHVEYLRDTARKGENTNIDHGGFMGRFLDGQDIIAAYQTCHRWGQFHILRYLNDARNNLLPILLPLERPFSESLKGIHFKRNHIPRHVFVHPPEANNYRTTYYTTDKIKPRPGDSEQRFWEFMDDTHMDEWDSTDYVLPLDPFLSSITHGNRDLFSFCIFQKERLLNTHLEAIRSRGHAFHGWIRDLATAGYDIPFETLRWAHRVSNCSSTDWVYGVIESLLSEYSIGDFKLKDRYSLDSEQLLD